MPEKRVRKARGVLMGEQLFKYLVTVCGGTGPDVWDNEFTVTALNIFEALSFAKKQCGDDHRMPSDWWITSIAQED